MVTLITPGGENNWLIRSGGLSLSSPVGPTDPYWSNVILSLNCDGANNSTTFVDLSNQANVVTAQGSAKVTTTDPKFGTGSLIVGASTDRLSLNGGSLFDIEYATPFTLEAFIFIPTITTNQYFIEIRKNSDLSQSLRMQFITTNRADIVVAGGQMSTGNNTVPTNQWAHHAVTWDGSLLRYFINGSFVQSATRLNQGSFGTCTIAIGGRNNGTNSMSGRIDELRFTKGIARYTANFTPPSAAFPQG
jgi:hypothetical protein